MTMTTSTDAYVGSALASGECSHIAELHGGRSEGLSELTPVNVNEVG